jgi:hypothetical protein
MQSKMQTRKLKSWLYKLAIFSAFLIVPMVTYAAWADVGNFIGPSIFILY